MTADNPQPKADPNMRIWNQVKVTNPAHTKPVNIGDRKFTSIDAMWQIQRCTELWGPIGEGWMYRADHQVHHVVNNSHVLAVCDIEFYWGAKAGGGFDNTYGPVRGTNWICRPGKSGNLILDEDAPKKALTDALTKALSHLGFSADVFLGRFDDNKYVQAQIKLHSGQGDEEATGSGQPVLPAIMERIKQEIPKVETIAALEEMWHAEEAAIRADCNEPQVKTILGWFGERKRKLQNARSKA